MAFDVLPRSSKICSDWSGKFSIDARDLRGSPGFKFNHQVLAATLKSCAARFAVNLGTALHGYALKQGHVSCQSVSKALLNMYAKCAKLGDCKRLFGHVDRCDPVNWNIVISGFSGSFLHNNEVIRWFCAMHSSGEAKPNPITFATVLPVCARFGDFSVGKSLHSCVIKSGFEANNLVGNALITMYSKSGVVCSDAYSAFRSIGEKDVVSWNAIITGFAENCFIDDAFRLFSLMIKGPVKPNNVTTATILPVCALLDRKLAHRSGNEIHSYVLQRTELSEDVFVRNSLLSFYLKLGKIEEAEFLFHWMEMKDLISWNAIISGYSENGEWFKAMTLFRKLVSLSTIEPDSVTIVSTLRACAHLRYFQVGKMIHAYILRHPFLHNDTVVGNSLISYYAKCNDVFAASQTFQMMSGRDMISWNSILDAFVESGYLYDHQVLNLLASIFEEGKKPDFITMLILVRFCVNISAIQKVKEAHGYSIRASYLLGNVEPTLGNAILDAYAKCGDVQYANNVFQTLLDKRNLVAFNSMISCYTNIGSHEDAHTLFNKMSETDLTTWNLMIKVYSGNGHPDQALHLLQALQAQGLRPDAMTVLSLIPVFTQMASVQLLKQCHGYVVRACFSDAHLMAALLDVYCKCGVLNSAYMIYKSIPQKDLVMITAMICGFSVHGMGEEALGIFSHMLQMGLSPDHVIITAVLSACSHAGLVKEGLTIFYSAKEVYGIKPTMEQYACVVDLLARSGKVDEAFTFVNDMPIVADASIWATLLGACKSHYKVELGCFVADKLFEIEADNIGNYVVMANLYASESRWECVAEIRRKMQTRDLKKPAGCSWIEVERVRNVFIAGDCYHPERSAIYGTLTILDKQIKNQSSSDLVDA